MKVHLTGHYPRRNGMTIALVDLAIANALAGKQVWYCSTNWNMTEHAKSAVSKRLRAMAFPQAGVKFHLDRVTFETGGSIEFHTTNRRGFVPPMPVGRDVEVEDAGSTGRIEVWEPERKHHE